MLPPNQQLVAPGKWPLVGERGPRADDAPWNVAIGGEVGRPVSWSLSELLALPRVERVVDIHCVTRWSKPGVRFSGILLATLLQHAIPNSPARFVSFVARSERAHSTSLPLAEALSCETLIAFEADGLPLTTDHGGPIRVIVPGRYFYKSLKWLERIELLAEDRLGYWEETAGYHNRADPWAEERYMAPTLSRAETAALMATRDWSSSPEAPRDLRGLQAGGRRLEGLIARNVLLRDADFNRCELKGADLRGSNFSNAHFAGASLYQADFRRADCEGADFAGADLRAADFRDASLFGATLFHADPTVVTRIDGTTRFSDAVWSQLVSAQAETLRRMLDSQ